MLKSIYTYFAAPWFNLPTNNIDMNKPDVLDNETNGATKNNREIGAIFLEKNIDDLKAMLELQEEPLNTAGQSTYVKIWMKRHLKGRANEIVEKELYTDVDHKIAYKKLVEYGVWLEDQNKSSITRRTASWGFRGVNRISCCYSGILSNDEKYEIKVNCKNSSTIKR